MGGCVSAQIGCVGNESKKKNSGKKNKPTSRRRRGGAIRRRVCSGLSDSSSLDAHNNNNKRSARPSTDRSFTNHTFQDQNMGDAMKGGVMDVVHSTVFKESEKLEGKHIKIEGYDFNQGVDYTKLLNSYCSTGFQASSLGEAIEVVNQMLEWKLSAEDPAEDCSEEEIDKVYRDSVRFRVDVVVTTAGGVEEDLVKCLAPTYKGEFSLPGALFRSKGLNRIGNLLVPNENYCQFEDWILPVFDKMLEDQHSEDIAGTCTLAMEVAEDSAQVAKLRSALESVDHKRRKILQQMRSDAPLLALENGALAIQNPSTAGEDARLASLISLDGIMKQVKDIMRQSSVNTLSKSRKKALLASLDELAERMPSLLDIDHPCAWKQITEARHLVESVREEDEAIQPPHGRSRLSDVGETDVSQWNVLQFNTGSTTPFIIKCGANSSSELVIKADARVQEPKGGEIVRVVPRPSVLESMGLEEMKEVFAALPEALSLLALARTADGTRARYSRLYRTLAMKVPSLRDLVGELEKVGVLKDVK